MFKKLNFSFLIILLITSVISTYAQKEEDVEGSKDHPLISRYEGSYIKGYEHYDYNRIVFAHRTDDGEIEEIAAEGEVTRILYVAPEGLSSLQVHRNYQLALKNAGFEILYDCIDEGGEECHRFFVNYNETIDGNKDVWYGKHQHYFLAKYHDPEGDTYVSAHTMVSNRRSIDNHPVTALQIVREKPLETGKVKVEINAEAMANEIDEKGSVRIYGIYFDTDKATIKKESESVLAEIELLLENEPDLSLGIVGHTDATGSIEHNMDLSQKRAEAVVEYLISQHGIPEDRLTPQGVGPWAPVAGNDDKDGRARNRRVELIKL